MLLWGRKDYVRYSMWNNEEVDIFLEQIDHLFAEPAKEWTNEMVTLSIYGIAVLQKPEGEAAGSGEDREKLVEFVLP